MPSREEQKYDRSKSTSNTVWLNLHAYIYNGLTLDNGKSLGETNILSFNTVFNSLSHCFVYLVLFYKTLLTFVIYFTYIVSLYHNDSTPHNIDR